MTNINAEAIVIGSGPAGMGVALGLVRAGVKVAILEKYDRIGAVRRGETIRFDKEMDDLLGTGFFTRHAIKEISKRTYYSHSSLQEIHRKINNPNIIISWPEFIGAIGEILLKEGVAIYTSATVTGFLEKKGRITGVMAVVDGAVKEIPAKAVFSCGGHEDPACQYLRINRSRLDLPAIKQLANGYTGPPNKLEYFFHIEDGFLNIGTIFPRGNNEAEFILIDFRPGNKRPRLTLEQFADEHPLFAKRLSGTTIYYSLNTFIPMSGMLRTCSPKPGLVITGDAMGHVQARGGSGIRTSFMISYTAGKLAAKACKSGRWSRRTSAKLDKQLAKSPVLKSLRNHNLVFSKIRPFLFSKIRSAHEMDKYWPIIKHALR